MTNNNTSTNMNFTQAMARITEIKHEFGEPLLETMQYMQDNLADFDEVDQQAFRVVMNDFRKLLTPA